MSGPPVITAVKKFAIVLSIFASELSIAEAARKEKVSEQSIGRWKEEFLEASKTVSLGGKTGPSNCEAQLEAKGAELTRNFGEVAVQVWVWKKGAEGRLGQSLSST